MSVSPSLTALPACVFSCRIVVIDYYLAPPIKNIDVCFSEFRSSPVERVPVIRIFGATPAGQKSCVHVHGAFPYLLVPCLVLEPSESYLQQLARSIDHALQVSLGASSRTANHVFKIVVVKGIPFYGYHETEEIFLRIYLINPGLIKRLAELLLAGAVMNQVLQPHESHIPFPLQFMIDYNLFGMHHIHLSAAKFRLSSDAGGENGHSEVNLSPSHSTRRRRSMTSPLLSPLSSSPTPSLFFHPSQNVWDTNTLPSDMILCEPRQSVTELEVDVLAADILNRHELSLVSDGYPGLAAIWEEERQRRASLNIDDPLSPPPSPDRATQPYHLEERRLMEVFESVLEERLGSSADLAALEEEEVLTPSDDVIFSQSCDLDVHQPIESEEVAGSESVADGDYEVLVDEGAVKQSMELSQRLSKAAIEKSTDAEMLELMAELCQTPTAHSQFPSSSQSVGERLTSKLRRSHSILSAKSLFSADSADETEESDDDLDMGGASLGGGGASLRGGGPSNKEVSELEGAELEDECEKDSGDDLFIAMETDIDDRKFPSPVVKITSETQRQWTPQRSVPTEVAMATSRLTKSMTSSTKSSVVRVSGDGERGESGEESEVDLPIRTPLTSPMPPSPKSKQLQSDILRELDSFGSDEIGRELAELGLGESQFDISLGQIQTPSNQCSCYSRSHPELEEVWNTSSSDSPLRLPTEQAARGERSSRSNVQLEFEMPELEGSASQLFNALGVESPRTTLVKGQQTVSTPVKSGLVTMTSSLRETTRQLLARPTTRRTQWEEGSGPTKEGQRRRSKRIRSKSEDIPQLDGVNDRPSTSSSTLSRKRKRTLGLKRGRKRRRRSLELTESSSAEKMASMDSVKTDEDKARETAEEEGRKLTALAGEEGGEKCPLSADVASEVLTESLEEEVASWGAEVQVTTGKDEVVTGPLSKEQQSGEEKSGHAKSKKGEASSDDLLLPKGKERRRLSLRKSVSRTYRMRERVSKPKNIAAPKRWRQSGDLVAQALKRSFVIKVDKVRRKSGVHSVSWSPAAAARQRTRGREEEEKTKTSPRKETRSVSRLKSESEDSMSGGSGREREVRKSRRRNQARLTSPIPIEKMSFEQQLKKAIEMSKETYLAESAEIVRTKDKAMASSCEQVEEAGSPVMFSPPPSDDWNRRVVEESPEIEKGCVVTSQDKETTAAEREEGEEGRKGGKQGVREEEEEEEREGLREDDGDGWNLDLTISSVSESPPFTSSPRRDGEEEEELLYESNLKLELESSMSDLEPPAKTSSPVKTLYETNSAIVSEGEIPSMSLANEVAKDKEAPQDDVKGVGNSRSPLTFETAGQSSEKQGQMEPLDESSLSLPSSPEVAERQREGEEASSIDQEGEEFHLAYSSSSASDEEGVGVARGESPASLDFSIEKTSSAVRLARWLSPAAEYRQTKERKTAVEDMGVVNGGTSGRVWLCPALDPPTLRELTESASMYNLRSVCHQQPFYSCPTDVQRPLLIGSRVLRVASRMPYDLNEFHVRYSQEGESDSAQFSSVGLNHMRTVLSMTARTNRNNPYSFDDYKRDVELRASFFREESVVITPALPPPHPSKFAALMLEAKAEEEGEGNNQKKKKEKGKKKNEEERQVCEGERKIPEVLGDPPPPSPLPPQSPPDSTINIKDQLEGSVAPPPEDKSHHPAKSSSVCRSDASFDDSVHDSSLTSYQLPCYHGHSTPMVVGVTRDGSDGVESMEAEENVSLTPVRQKNGGETTKPRSVLPFTPIPAHPKRDHSQLEGPTPNNTFGFKVSQSALPGSCDIHDVQFLTCMSVELHVRTRGSLRPDPDFDPILAIFYYIHNDWPLSPDSDGERGGVSSGKDDNVRLGVIAVDELSCSPSKTEGCKGQRSPTKGSTLSPLSSPAKCLSPSPSSSSESSSPRIRRYLEGCGLASNVEVSYAASEVELIEKLIELVRRVDPDFLLGYEITMVSWGYLIDRAATLNINLTNELSRMPGASQSDRSNHGDNSGWKTMLNIIGRIMFSVWRLLKYEIALNVYTFENVTYHILHSRVPNYSFKTLTSWYDHPTSLYRHRVVEHYLTRCQGNYQLIESFNLIGRTSEFSRLYGIEFESVVNRGCQYRVESMMLRLAKPANFVAVSPSVQQRARMAAPECLPLVLEPESKFYADPVLVLDFQSLYPSMVIAYNYCFSTCLGKVYNLAAHGNFQFGASSLNVPNGVLKKLKDKIHISPNGVVFVKHHVRRGILTRMLEEILGTRIMVKSSMKKHKQNKALERMLNARQLGLKLIANTTYGYTGASFSGRMPCIEVADSIVRKGRETLERAIQMVNSSPEWQARVVYGDTDSLFVLLKGASKEEAFRIGKEICERVTADNPKPVKLKFEKIYLPCILQTKKRYVGFMYETLEQKEAEFDAKGIETVRRDGCPAVAKILEKSLRLLYSSKDVSLVKSYVQRQFKKVLEGRVDLKDYTFAKEYRGRQYYRPGASVPALELTKHSLTTDRRTEPRVGERVPYVVVYGTPGQPLIQQVRRPENLLDNPGLRLNGVYYITKQLVPALDRCFSLLGVDVRQWYSELPQVRRAPVQVGEGAGGRRARGTIGQYFATMHCPVCEELTVQGVCPQCRKDPAKVATTLSVRMKEAERACCDIEDICRSCVGSLDPSWVRGCVSLDCPVNYRRFKATQENAALQSLRHLLTTTLPA